MTFRLCAQHPKAYVSKLPPELVAMIEDFVIQHARSRMRASLFQSYQCFKAECKLRDHASELGADDVKRYERIYEECCTDGDFCSDHRDEMLENGCFCKDVREAHVEYTDMWSCEIASHWNMEPYSEHNSSPRPLAKVSNILFSSMRLLISQRACSKTLDCKLSCRTTLLTRRK